MAGMNLKKSIDSQLEKTTKPRKIQKTGIFDSGEKSNIPAIQEVVISRTKVTKSGRPAAFSGEEVTKKFFGLPKTTCKKIILGKMELNYSTEAEFVNAAILEFCRHNNI